MLDRTGAVAGCGCNTCAVHRREWLRIEAENVELYLADAIRERIEANHDVTVRDGVVTSEPCQFDYGYGKGRQRS